MQGKTLLTPEKRRRKEAGQWFAQRRKDANLTQKDLANILGFEYYTTVSQIENGVIAFPIDSLEKFCKATDTPVFDALKKWGSSYTPDFWNMFLKHKPEDFRHEALPQV